jgi:DNA repair protein RecN (Recombination protein N)
MLKYLEIQNYALIERLNIDFQTELSVITGETGAGKSIILGALGLVLGQRADAKVILSDAGKCVVEAVFDVSINNLKPFFDENEIEYFDECIVRREILQSGKSRSFINDMPVNLQILKDLTSQLIDIHSQHESLLLGNSNFQLNTLDLIAQTNKELEIYKGYFVDYQQKRCELQTLQEQAEKAFAEKDYAEFQFTQLSEAKLIENEQIELEKELNLINHSQEISEALSGVSAIFSTEQFGIVNQINTALNSIRKIEKYLTAEQNFSERIYSSMIEIKDINAEIEAVLSNTEFNPERKNIVEQRLNLIYSFEQKHRVSTITELLVLQRDFEKKLLLIENFDDEIQKIRKILVEIEQNLEASAKKLSEKRETVQMPVKQQVESTLALLGMPNARFEIGLSELENFTQNGKDKIEFLFSANKNREPQAISQIASGGEISRLMLVIKSLVIASANLPTIIFDEIDTGISGEVAKKMGEILQKIGGNMQVIAITHLPQIAAKGKTHYKVFKDESGISTKTNILQLTDAERIMEIAEMISGKNPSGTAIKSAKELLDL